ncbi:hypothetical protein [Streptomyces laurentii]|uniref:hypothetical protein n=1 Tax=Streptomyces laurentii TaxID=39478 RepID=UPI0036913547
MADSPCEKRGHAGTETTGSGTGADTDDAAELAPLKAHFRVPSSTCEVGPGWRALVLSCHQAIVAEFPDYELVAVKQKWAALAFQAFPRPWEPGGSWTADEARRLDALVDVFTAASEHVCERCAAAGRLRESRPVELTLCDACESDVGPDGRLSRPRPTVRGTGAPAARSTARSTVTQPQPQPQRPTIRARGIRARRARITGSEPA